MKLQRQLSRERGGEEYHKWVIVLPPSQMEELEWEEGLELKSIVNDNSLTIRPMTEEEKKEKSEEKMSYEEFKETVKEVLEKAEEAMVWTKVREEGDLEQKVPSNVWVRRLEEDIGLIREKKGNRTVWRLE
ncbi:hypothetical protein AKJ45_00920 [candidate division MSBL1 archaeon SCGC-AAA261F19]|uniref:Uncharacterized protein n=2 Tax=candidate division MSBL1 TaxID=215777 RepID=A0A133VB56_9EURY|nr:hypothetical protein AKJ43_02840 [candidate division MSBL1 archaeon SCGC-AAA261D19]KXB03660.1 hypothetical protein AKJ45_00920 [candidate division MSBL1 archaeon SCGC-AAA261F19]